MTRAVLPTLPGTLRRVGRSQARNVFHALRGEPVMTPPLDSVTLDQDDVEIAQSWLRNRSCWSDRHVVAQYEGEFARWNGSRYAFAFASGRVALSACIDAMAFQPGDEVILPGYTCFPVPNALCYANLVPVYCDIELGTYGLDVSAVRRKITKRTRAIILQHLYGLVSRDYDAILELALQCDLRVIEDCAHATGAEYRGVKAGTRGHVGFYSSHQSKIFNTSQGGIAVTNEPDIARRLQACYERAPETSPEQTEGLLRNVLLNYYELKHPQRWWRGDLVAALHGHERLKGASPGEERGRPPCPLRRENVRTDRRVGAESAGEDRCIQSAQARDSGEVGRVVRLSRLRKAARRRRLFSGLSEVPSPRRGEAEAGQAVGVRGDGHQPRNVVRGSSRRSGDQRLHKRGGRVRALRELAEHPR